MIIRFVSTADAERQNTQSQKTRTMATTLLGRYLTGLCLILFNFVQSLVIILLGKYLTD